jgi:hypothetical protein
MKEDEIMFQVNAGDTAFVLISAALVCIMTPDLAFFYGGLVRRKNVLIIMMQSFISLGIVTTIWVFGGFSLAFGPDVGGVIGKFKYFLLNSVTAAPNPTYGSTIPFFAFFIFQEMFAIITPALITGAVAGLATITPCAGYVPPWAAAIIGLLSAVICYLATAAYQAGLGRCTGRMGSTRSRRYAGLHPGWGVCILCGKRCKRFDRRKCTSVAGSICRCSDHFGIFLCCNLYHFEGGQSF